MTPSHSQDLCTRCTNPGRCCTGFDLPNIRDKETALEVLVELATVHHGMSPDGLPVRIGQPSPGAEHGFLYVQLGLPFMPLRKTSTGLWQLWCPLLVSGRCSDYENRPALCRHFRAGSDKLCCMWEPPIASDDPLAKDSSSHL